MGTGPLPELDTTRGADAVTDGQDQIKIIMGNLALNLAVALGSNCQGFLDSCLRR